MDARLARCGNQEIKKNVEHSKKGVVFRYKAMGEEAKGKECSVLKQIQNNMEAVAVRVAGTRSAKRWRKVSTVPDKVRKNKEDCRQAWRGVCTAKVDMKWKKKVTIMCPSGI